MLEEAAGTRMYETKKDAALKTLEKKQTKVDEIDKLLEEEILPTIEKLRKERGDYMEWQLGNDSLGASAASAWRGSFRGARRPWRARARGRRRSSPSSRSSTRVRTTAPRRVPTWRLR